MRKETKSRKPIEIYFVLYLSALVLLISKPNKVNDAQIQIQNTFELPFTIKAEKPMLVYRTISDSLGNKHVEIDSINNIWDVGDVEDVHYEFVVEDQSLKHSVRLSHNISKENKFFKFKEDSKNRMATFYWHPSIHEQENKTFIVFVAANAKLKNADNNERVKAQTQFSLVITHDNAYDNYQNLVQHGNIDNNITSNQNHNQYINRQLSDEINLYPQYYKINNIASVEWSNKIFYSGINPKKELALKIKNDPESNGGSAYIASYDNGVVTIKGKTPVFGTTKISLTALRKSDYKEAAVSFDIRPQEFEAPEYPRIMYPEQTYRLNPKLPLELDNASAMLKDGNTVRVEVRQGGIIEFTPSTSDVGKILSFERFANGISLGIRNIKIAAYPPPEIVRISETATKNVLIMQVNSYGIYNGKENIIQRINLTGNAISKQLYGKTAYDKINHIWTELFEITIADSDKPFKFKVTAVDSRGTASKEKECSH